MDGLCASYIRAFVDRTNFDFLSFTTYVFRFGLRSHELIHLLDTIVVLCILWVEKLDCRLVRHAASVALQILWIILLLRGASRCAWWVQLFLFLLFPRVSYTFLLKFCGYNILYMIPS